MVKRPGTSRQLAPLRRRFRGARSLVLGAAAASAALTNLPHAFATTVSYVMQTGNFNIGIGTTGLGSSNQGWYNNSATEIGIFANDRGQPSQLSGWSGFQTFTTGGVGSGTARPLQVGDSFTLTSFNKANPFGAVGIYFNDNATYSSYADYNTNNRANIVLGSSGNWKMVGTTSPDSGVGPNVDATLTIKITSSNTFIATVNGTTAYDMTMIGSPGTTSQIQSFALRLQNDNNGGSGSGDSFWKNGSLTDTGTVEFGTGGASSTITGLVSDGLAADSTSTVTPNSLVKNGSGSIALTATNTYTGTNTIAGGTLQVGADSNLGTAPSSPTDNLFIAASTTLRASSSFTLDANRNIVLGSAAGGDNGWIDVAPGQALIVAGVLKNNASGANGLVKFGAGTLTLSNASTYTGDTFITNGALAFDTGGSVASGFIRLGETSGSNSATLALIGNGGLNISTKLNVRSGSSGTKAIVSNNNAGTNTLSGNIFLDDSVTIAESNPGATLALSGTQIDLKNRTMTLIGNGDIVASGSLQNSTGNGIVTKNNTGYLVMSGSNSYTGDTNVNAGTLMYAASTINNASTIRLGDTSGTNAATLSLGNPAGGTFSQPVNVRAGSSGQKTITAANASGTTATYSGTITLDADVTVVSPTAGATLAFTGPNNFNLKNQTATFTGSGNTVINEVLNQSSAGGKLIKQGTGALTLTSFDNNSGAVTVTNGNLILSGTDGAMVNVSSIILNGGTFKLDNSSGNSIDREKDGGTVVFNGGSLAFVGKSDASASETVGTFSLGTSVAGGASTILVQNGTAGSTSAVLAGQALLHTDTQSTVNFVALNGTLGSPGNNPRVTFTIAPGTKNNVIADTSTSNIKGWVTVNGTGFANYNATNGVVAVATVDYASSSSSNDNVQLTTSATINSAGKSVNTLKINPSSPGQSITLTTNSGNLSTNAILLTGNDFVIQDSAGATGSVSSTATTYFYVDTGRTLTLGVLLSGNPVVKSGPGSLVFSNTGEAGRTDALTINSGVVGATPGTTLLGGGLAIRGGGVLEADATTTGVSFTRALGTSGSAVSIGPGGGGFSAVGSAGNNVFTVNIGGAGASLTWGAANFLGDDQPLVLGSSFANRTVDFTNPLDLNGKSREVMTNGSSSLLAGKLSGLIGGTAVTSTLIKSGPAALSLTAANTYAGGTIVSAGKLLVNNTSGSGTGSGNVTVSSGASLAGSGTISGNTTFASGSSVSPGDFGSAGKLSVANFTLTTGATLQVEVGGDHTTPGITFDQIAVTGSGKTFVVGGANLSVIPVGSVDLHVPYRIVDATGNSVDSTTRFANLTNGVTYNDGGTSYTVSYDSASIDITFNSVPEPGSLAVFAVAGLGQFIRPRRRGKQSNRQTSKAFQTAQSSRS